MVEQKKLSAEEVGAMLSLSNMTPSSFHSMKSFLQTYFDYQMFASKANIRSLYKDAIAPTVDICKENQVEIAYCYKNIEQILKLVLKDEIEIEPDIMRRCGRLHLLFSGDHGAEKM